MACHIFFQRMLCSFVLSASFIQSTDAAIPLVINTWTFLEANTQG